MEMRRPERCPPAGQRNGWAFTYEGLFRQAVVYKGRNRDTAWYAVLDSEWPRLEAAYAEWLDPGNFDARRAAEAEPKQGLLQAHRG